jgi:alanyl-tRNA synthetase
VAARVEALEAQRRALERDLAQARKALALGGGAAGSSVEDVAGLKFDGRVIEGVSAKDMRPLVDEARKRLGEGGVVAYAAVNEGKASIAVALTADLVGRFDASSLARAAVAAMGGQGAGGKPDFAQGGAPDGARAAEGVAAVKAALAG